MRDRGDTRVRDRGTALRIADFLLDVAACIRAEGFVVASEGEQGDGDQKRGEQGEESTFRRRKDRWGKEVDGGKPARKRTMRVVQERTGGTLPHPFNRRIGGRVRPAPSW